jgi:hypothetical protein
MNIPLVGGWTIVVSEGGGVEAWRGGVLMGRGAWDGNKLSVDNEGFGDGNAHIGPAFERWCAFVCASASIEVAMKEWRTTVKATLVLDYVDVGALAMVVTLAGARLFPAVPHGANVDLMIEVFARLTGLERVGEPTATRAAQLDAWLRVHAIWTAANEQAAPTVVPEPIPLLERLRAHLEAQPKDAAFDLGDLAEALAATPAEVAEALARLGR